MNFIKKNNLVASVLFAYSIIIFLSLITHNKADPSLNLVTSKTASNLLGIVGSYLSDILIQYIGHISSYLLALIFAVWSVHYFNDKNLNFKWLKISLACYALISLGTILSIIKYSSLSQFFSSLEYIKVGFINFYLSKKILLLFSEYNILRSLAFLKNILPSSEDEAVNVLALTMLTISCLVSLYFTLSIRLADYIYFIKLTLCKIHYITTYPFVHIKFFKNLVTKLFSLDNSNAFYASDGFSLKNDASNVVAGNNARSMSADNFAKNNVSGPPPKAINKSATYSAPAISADSIMPSLDLLDNQASEKIKYLSAEQIASRIDDLLNVLSDFGVKGKVVNVKQGPVVTLYEFEPAAGTKSSRVIGLSDDIARSLSAISARIAVMPGRNALGIELPNEERMFFRLKNLLETQEFNDKSILLPLILGKDLGGDPYVADLAKMPHLLVAGTTGSGKSVAINTMIMSLLYRYGPDDCKMIMIDPKMLELSAYDGIPHLLTPVVTEPGKAIVALKWAVKEMENRYRLMSNMGVRNIANFNSKIFEAIKSGKVIERQVQTGFDPESGKPIYENIPVELKKMPFIVVIVDEMADLMLVAGKDIEASIQRLAQMARAAGIHIIMATQRPSVDVITGVIKANFPSRISFKVTSKIDSRTILGEQGSEQLLGRGDMLYMGTSSKILRVHGPFVDDGEVQRVTDFLRTSGSPEYINAVTESFDEETVGNGDGASYSSSEDDLYSKAVEIVRLERKASISYIQRSLRIGYNKAANIVEEMERKGILSEPNHSGKREILLPE